MKRKLLIDYMGKITKISAGMSFSLPGLVIGKRFACSCAHVVEVRLKTILCAIFAQALFSIFCFDLVMLLDYLISVSEISVQS